MAASTYPRDPVHLDNAPILREETEAIVQTILKEAMVVTWNVGRSAAHSVYLSRRCGLPVSQCSFRGPAILDRGDRVDESCLETMFHSRRVTTRIPMNACIDIVVSTPRR